MPLNNKVISLLLSLTTLFMLCRPAQAQAEALGLGELIREVRETVAACRDYRNSHERLPQFSSELDELLFNVFKRVSLTPANTMLTPQSVGNFRVYYQFAVTFDSSIRGLPVINGQLQVPPAWQAPANTIVIFSDGENQFAVWAAGGDGRPILDPTTNVPMVVTQTVDPRALPK